MKHSEKEKLTRFMSGEPSQFNRDHASRHAEVNVTFDGRSQLTLDEREAWAAWEEAMSIMPKLGFRRWTAPRLVPAMEQYGDKASVIFEVLLDERQNADMAHWVLRSEFEAHMTREASDRLTFAVANVDW